MAHPVLTFPKEEYTRILQHLLPRRSKSEEAAFAFVRPGEGDPLTFGYLQWLPVPPSGFESRSALHLELTDEMRSAVIKRAHDLHASIVEFHSHLYGRVAEFSGSDVAGFQEFVPHVIWRLKGKPYFAIVVTRFSFDALSWLEGPDNATQVACLRVGSEELRPTNRTVDSYSGAQDEVAFRP